MDDKVHRILKQTTTDRELAELRQAIDTNKAVHDQMRLDEVQYLMLEIRTRRGQRVGFPYSYLVEVSLEVPRDDEIFLELVFSSRRIRLRGRNLQSLFEMLLGHSLKLLEEDASEFDTGEEFIPYIREIEFIDLA
jgi:hypothetical protein